jgi:hypothetical protein
MATASGVVRYRSLGCPLKYQGLAPWEILVSESQERMSLAVPPESMAPFLALAARRGVETTEVGIFTDTGFMEILHDGKMVGAVSLAFLHEGNPRMELRAVWTPCRESGGATYRAAGGGLAALPADSDGQALRISSARTSPIPWWDPRRISSSSTITRCSGSRSSSRLPASTRTRRRTEG